MITTPKYNLGAKWHIKNCLRSADNPILFRSNLRYAMYDLGLDSQ